MSLDGVIGNKCTTCGREDGVMTVSIRTGKEICVGCYNDEESGSPILDFTLKEAKKGKIKWETDDNSSVDIPED